jgi:crossover junction endodeoxyribonuclease RuvC
MFTIGIDPGNAGGMALLCGTGFVVAHPLPLIAAAKKSKKMALDVHAFAAIVRNWMNDAGGDICAVIEDVHAMPGQGVTSMFSFGRGMGKIEGVFAALGIPIEYVSPQTWKRFYKLGPDKEQSRLVAQRAYPKASLNRKKDEGIAEAILIAVYYAHERKD